MSPTELTTEPGGNRSPDHDNVFESAWKAFTSSVGKEIAVITGVLAFVRLLAVSHLDLDTARAILQHGDLTELAGGLVLSAALLWLPILVGIVVHGLLSMQSVDDLPRVGLVDLAVGVVSVGGIFVTFSVVDLDLGDIDEIARGGLSFGAIAALIGAGGAALIHYAGVSVDAQRTVLENALAGIEADNTSDTPGTSGTSGTLGTSGAPGTAGMSGTAGTSGASGASGASGTAGMSGTSGTGDTSGTARTPGTANTPGVAGTSGTPGASGTARTAGTSGNAGTAGAAGTSLGEADPEPDGVGSIDDGAGARTIWQRLPHRWSKAFRALWFGVMSLWLILLALLMVLAVLTEPSQPAENVTITQNGTTETRTVHVIDDGGDEWIVMLRDSRRILSVDASSVADRYICRAVGISWRETLAVTAKTVEPMRMGAAAPPDGDRVYGAAEVRRRSVELDSEVLRSAADRWVKRMGEQPPPCQPEWSSSEVESVRRDLGLVCNDLGRCVPADPDDG